MHHAAPPTQPAPSRAAAGPDTGPLPALPFLGILMILAGAALLLGPPDLLERLAVAVFPPLRDAISEMRAELWQTQASTGAGPVRQFILGAALWISGAVFVVAGRGR